MKADTTLEKRGEALARCETEIRKGLQSTLTSAINVGQALATIKRDGLYRDRHETWEQYLKATWNISPSSARGYISKARVGQHLLSQGFEIHTVSPKAIEPLIKLSPTQQIEAAAKALELAKADDDRLTIKHTRQAASVITKTPGCSEQDMWRTPPNFVEDYVRPVLGEIDLDPATHEEAQQIVNAKQYFTEGALTREWRGRVYLNPPYSNPLCRHFIAKLIEEIDAHRVTAALVLVNSRTDTKWFQSMANRFAYCFLKNRLEFWPPKSPPHPDKKGQNLNQQTVFYFGEHEPAFVRAFRDAGAIGAPIE